MAALICTKPGHRPRLIYRIHLDHGPARGRRKGFTETDYAPRLLDAAHQQLGGPIVLVWDCENGGISFGTVVLPGLTLTMSVMLTKQVSRACCLGSVGTSTSVQFRLVGKTIMQRSVKLTLL